MAASVKRWLAVCRARFSTLLLDGPMTTKRARIQRECESYRRAVVVHERAATEHEQAAVAARLTGDPTTEAYERELARKEREAAKHARSREASTVAVLVALGL